MITFTRLACLGASFSSGWEALSHVEPVYIGVYTLMSIILTVVAANCGRKHAIN